MTEQNTNLVEQFKAVQTLKEFDALAKPNKYAILNIDSVGAIFMKKLNELQEPTPVHVTT